MKRHLLLAIALLLISPAAFAMRCNGSLVKVGLQDFQVRDRCGAPFYTDSYTTTEVTGAHTPQELYRDVQYDVWYYNFGPRELMHRIVFRDGWLSTEETLGYGVDEIGGDCNPNRDWRGLSVGELVARCGEPASRRTNTDTIVHREPGYAHYRDVRREEWFYDFGDDRLMRVVHLVDGRVDGSGNVER